MKRAILTSLIFFTVFSFLLAQNGSIQGTVSDQTTNDKNPFAAVTVISENEPFQNGSISNGDGYFSIDNLKPGNYKLLVSFMGYKTDTISELPAGRPIRRKHLCLIQVSGVPKMPNKLYQNFYRS